MGGSPPTVGTEATRLLHLVIKMASSNFKVISINIAMSILSVNDILRLDKPDLLLVQEISNSTQTLSDQVSRLGYSAECNVDPLHPNLPGTALAWKNSIKFSDYKCLIERRAQSIKIGSETYMNIYAPSGTANRKLRWAFFNELFLHLLPAGGEKLPVLAGDFNAVLTAEDTARNFAPKYCKVLDNLVTQLNYTDSFRHLHPTAREYTFHRGANIAQSRLDRVYLPPHLVNKLVSVSHQAGISDHSKVELKLALTVGQTDRLRPERRKTFWKLNTSLLDDPNFKIQFQILYTRLSNLIPEYEDHGQWWEELAKPTIVVFLKDFSYKFAKQRKSTKLFLYSLLNIFLKQENWGEVAVIKEKIRKMLVYDSMGVMIRSRIKEYAEEEKGSIYHYNRERKKTGSSSLTKLKYMEGNVEKITSEPDKIEQLVVNFYDALLNGRHDKNLHDTGVPFQPSDVYLEEFLAPLSTLTQEAKVDLVKEVTHKEIGEIVKSCPNGKSPGLDGIPYEFYKVMWEVIGRDFTEVVKAQLANFSLIESGRHGATVLPSKVDGVPNVTELRPITLLCCDYRILTKTLNDRMNPVMGEVVKSSQLAAGEKEKNILTGVYDIVSTIDYVNKHDKPAFIASYDMVKAYDRTSIKFLCLVMERMQFPEVFRRWIEMCHQNATTCLVLPSGLSREISVTFSFRQGDPFSMNLYILQQEPLLKVVRNTLSGITITNFRQLDKDYCDDVENLSNDVQDLVKFDEIMKKFEATSGAILSRNKKSKVMGLGSWQGKQNWPEEVNWIKTVEEMKVFGFLIYPTYQETLQKTWEKVVSGFEKVLFSWQSRSLETLSQKVEVAKIFALSKLYYVAQVLPLPSKFSTRIESSLSKFIFRGRHERLMLSELENDCEQGGLGLPNISIKADSLLLKQTLRMLSLPNEDSFRHLGYWLGAFLTDNFPELLDLGPVSQVMSPRFPLHQYMLDTLEYGMASQEFEKNNLSTVTTKSIYRSRLEMTAIPPKVEKKFPNVDFQNLVYPRLTHPVLEAKQKDLLFALVHAIYPNRARLSLQGRANDALCPHIACRMERLTQDIEHIFCTCHKVRAAWQWLRDKMMGLLSGPGPPPVLSNITIIMAMFPKDMQETECMFLLGTYIELVDREAVSKQKELLLNTLLGVLQTKAQYVRSRAVPQFHLFLP